ncbi:MAG: hypothetical protein MZV63_14355 [Marinilabiliales bacterium]|nr:hypothetical protein [Marinilabiliales bacterium]
MSDRRAVGGLLHPEHHGRGEGPGFRREGAPDRLRHRLVPLLDRGDGLQRPEPRRGLPGPEGGWPGVPGQGG